MKSMLLLSSFLLAFGMAAAQMSSKHFWHTLETDAGPDEIWRIWTDVANWQVWDSGLQEASLQAVWAEGIQGTLVSDKGRKVKFKVTEYVEGESYAFRMKLPGSSFTVRRFLEQKEGRTFFTHDVRFKGFTAGLFARALGKDYMKMLPGVLEKIKELAENQQLSSR